MVKWQVFSRVRVLGILSAVLILQSCVRDELSDLANTSVTFPNQLSSYTIYQGDPGNLIPAEDYQLYTLGAALFTDYAEKQRLIKVPQGAELERINDDLPTFPDGTIIVKTFFYFHDKRDTSKGKRILETRLLVKESGVWNVADYLWNENQTDAILIEYGMNTTVNFITENGEAKVINYHVPNNRECATCHSLSDEIVPIGPKLRNLNISVETELGEMNQIEYFQGLGLLENFDITAVGDPPVFNDSSVPIEERGRAYLDANCAHCHRVGGYAEAEENLFLDYGTSFEESNIEQNKEEIIEQLNQNLMPYLGTSVRDDEGIEIIEEYINSL